MDPGPRPEPGGIRRLERILADHPRQLEADLRRYYQLDLRDLWRPRGGTSRLTHRLLGVLYDELPGESATKTAQRDQIPDDQLAQLAKLRREGHGPWTHGELLEAAQIDVLRSILHVLIVSNGGKSNAPDPWPRPGVISKRRRALSREGFDYLMRLREDHSRTHEPDQVEGAG